MRQSVPVFQIRGEAREKAQQPGMVWGHPYKYATHLWEGELTNCGAEKEAECLRIAM